MPNEMTWETKMDNDLKNLTHYLVENLQKLIPSDSSAFPLKFVGQNTPCDGYTPRMESLNTRNDRDSMTTHSAWMEALNLTAPEEGECLSELAVQQVCGAGIKRSFQLPGENIAVYR